MQSGRYLGHVGSSWVAIPLAVAMRDTNYSVQATTRETGHDDAWDFNILAARESTTTQIIVRVGIERGWSGCHWEVRGYKA